KQNDAFSSLNPVRHASQRFSCAQGQECIARVRIDPERAFVQTEELFVHTPRSQALSAQTELTSLRRNVTAPAVLAGGRPIGPRNHRQSGHSEMHINILLIHYRLIPPLSYLHQAQTQNET